jgi:diaminohydroxyphosphoribosylaminopyrimidine deaminase/5-amino-6-(5-phosphoribosylamino)uracil reductase
VGAGTVRSDDPLLTNRSGAGKQPARVVLDEELRIPPDCRLLAGEGGSPVIVATCRAATDPAAEALARAGAEILVLAPGQGGVDLGALLDELGRRQWTYLLVEGGRGVLGQFLRQRLADELLVFLAPVIVGGAKSLGPVDWEDVDTIDQALSLPPPETERVGPDVLLRFFPAAVAAAPSAPGGQVARNDPAGEAT